MQSFKNVIYNLETYDDITIEKVNDQYKLHFYMTDSVKHVYVYKYNTMINKQQLFKLLMYLFYMIDDYRYYALPDNHQISNYQTKSAINFHPKSYYD